MNSPGALALALFVAALSGTAGVKLPKPDRIAAPPTPEQVALVREGVALHDQRDYDGAIGKYKQVLADNPWEVGALHELAFTYFESKDYERALAIAKLGVQCRSPLLVRFYVMIGNALDELGRGNEAIETYKAAIKLDPHIELLHYNLGVSLRRAGKLAEAKAEVETALKYDAAHASGHAFLGGIYRDMGYRVPAILAYTRFLELEPESPRAQQVLPVLQGLLNARVAKGTDPNHIEILLQSTPKSLTDEGDFEPVEMMLSIVVAADLIAKPEEANKKPASAFERLVSIYSIIGESLQNSKPKAGFAATYYAPYLAALTKAGHTEAFVTRVWKAGKVDGAPDWAAANEAKIDAFRLWSQEFKWPAK